MKITRLERLQESERLKKHGENDMHILVIGRSGFIYLEYERQKQSLEQIDIWIASAKNTSQ